MRTLGSQDTSPFKMQPTDTERGRTTNRRFLGATVAGSAAIVLSSNSLAKRVVASERIQLGVVGLGSRGTAVMQQFLDNSTAEIVALCDVHPAHYRDNAWGKGPKLGSQPAAELVSKKYAQRKKSGSYSGCQVFSDYRQLLQQNLDAVVIATPDHWHAKITLDAMVAGLDVYCEKPVTHHFAEGQIIYREAAKRGAVFQVGSQQRSDALFRRAVEIVRNGHLGKIRRIEVGLPIGYMIANDDPQSVEAPPELDYEMWCGPAPMLPYARAWHHRWWRAVRAFGGGVLMDWIGHHNDIAHWGIDESEGGPVAVEAVGWTPSACEQYDTPAEYGIRAEYAGDIHSEISTKLKQGTKWIGADGWVWVNRGKIEASNPDWLRSDYELGNWKAMVSNDHVDNFLSCVRSRQSCITSAEIGHRSITPGHLGYVSNAVGRPLKWNPKQERIEGDVEAQNLLLQMPYRAPWSLNS